MKKIAFVLLIIVSVPFLLVGKHNSIGNDTGIHSGILYNNFNALNVQLKDAGYPQINSISYTYGVRLNICFDRLLFGGNLYDIRANDYENDTAKTIISGRFTLLEFGYGIIKKKHYAFFPMIGLGIGGMSMKLIPDKNSFNNFNDISNIGSSSSLNTGLFVGELALQNNFIIVVSEKKKKKYIEKTELSINLKGGILYSFNNDWELEDFDKKISGLAKIPGEKYFLSIEILFGYYRIFPSDYD